MENDWKKRLGVVYSTSDSFDYDYRDKDQAETLPAKQQKLYVSLDRRNRKGKAVTLISGFRGSETDLKELGKELKGKCGVGGSVKEGEILLQGDHREKVLNILKDKDFQVKKSGG